MKMWLINFYCFCSQRKQRSNLLEVVQGNKGFANVHEDEKGLQVEKSMKQVSIQGGAQIEICNF